MQPDKNWAVERAQYQAKVCGDHESNPGGPIGCSWDQICPPWAHRGHQEPPKRVLLGPKRTLFACFLELGGSIWAKTVLNEPGIPLRRSGHPTSLYLKQKEVPKQVGHESMGMGPE